MAFNPSALKGRSARIFHLLRRYPAAQARPSRSPICKFQSPSTPIWISSSVCQTGQPASTRPHVLQVVLQSRTANVVVPRLCHSRCRLTVVIMAVILAFIAWVLTANQLLLQCQHYRPALPLTPHAV